MHQKNCFITLTYDNDHLPLGNSLEKEELKRFFKRLRHITGSFRYYAVGEYGDETLRPHYHAVLFGVDFSHDRKHHSKNKQGDSLYVSETLTNTWGLGHCYIGQFNYATAAYTARYVMKKQTGKNAQDSDIYSRLDCESGLIFQVAPVFACMSLKPGIGSTWYDKYKKDAFPSDMLVHKGKVHPVPKYYVNKLQKEDEKTHKLIKKKRRRFREETLSNSTPDRLFTREEVKKAQIKTLSREL